MTYRVSRSASNYELQNDHPNGGSEPYLHHYVHNAPQSASVANIQQLATLQRQQQLNPNLDSEYQTELHRFGQNADRFTTTGTVNTTVRINFLIIIRFEISHLLKVNNNVNKLSNSQILQYLELKIA